MGLYWVALVKSLASTLAVGLAIDAGRRKLADVADPGMPMAGAEPHEPDGRAEPSVRGAGAEESVAEATGFADAVHFGRTFRKLTGATPAAWRRDRRA